MDLLLRIPEHALTIDFVMGGRCDTFKDGFVHRKVAPCTIIAQACQGRYEVGSAAGTAMTETGGAFLAQAGESLAITHHGDPNQGGLMKARWIHARFLVFGVADFVSLLELPRTITARDAAPFGEIAAELLEMAARPPSLRDAARKTELGFRVLGMLCDLAPPSPAGLERIRGADRLGAAMHFVREHMMEGLTVDQLARGAHLSRSRLHALFQRHLRMPPMQYVKSVRIAEAARRLLLPDISVHAVAAQTGFANPYHFSREFKAAMGMSPAAYRQARASPPEVAGHLRPA